MSHPVRTRMLLVVWEGKPCEGLPYPDYPFNAVGNMHEQIELKTGEQSRAEALFIEKGVAGCEVTQVDLSLPKAKFLALYLITLVRNASGSEFAKRLENSQKLLDSALLQKLDSDGYNALLYHTKDGEILGHFAFQKRDSELHAFSIQINPCYRHLGLGEMMLDDFLIYARTRSDVSSVILGAGGHPGIQRMCERIASRLKKEGINFVEPTRFIFSDKI